MKRGWLLPVVIFAVAALALTACAQATPTPQPGPAATPTPTPAKVYTFKFSHFASPEAGPRWQMALKFAELVDQETKGQVKIEVYPANQLVKVAETETALAKGALDGAFHVDTYLVGVVPAIEFALMPGLATPETVYDIWYDTGLFDKFNTELMARGMFMAGFYSPGSVDIVVGVKKWFLKPEDMKGAVMRMWGGAWANAFREMGAGLATMPSAEVYLALQRGTAEGAGSAMSAAYGFKWQEVAPYWAYFQKGGLGGPYSVPYLFSLDKWRSLPPELQEAVLRAAKKSVPIAQQMRAEWDAGLVQKATAEGAKIKVPEPQDWTPVVGPLAKKHYFANGGILAQQTWTTVEEWHKKTGR